MRIRTVLLAASAAIALLAVSPAHADWRRPGWGGHPYYQGGYRPGPAPFVAGALLGLATGAVVAGAFAPPVVYAPPPVVYAPPPRVIYAPAPCYYCGY